jgi:hypothetical protein
VLLPVSEHIDRGGLPLALGNHPMLDANRVASVRIGPAGDIACSKNPGRTRFEITVDKESTASPASSASPVRGRTPMPTMTRSASSVSPLFSVTFLRPMALAVSSRWKMTPCSW